MHVYEVVFTFEYLQVIHSCFILENLKALGNSSIILPKNISLHCYILGSFLLLTNGD